MDSTKTTYESFPLEWTVKSTSHQILYRKAFNINEIDEIFCSIINANGNLIVFSELSNLLGFNIDDLAEMDVLNIYLNGLTEFSLVSINKEKIQLTEFGQEALQSKLKYKYCFGKTELLENQTAIGEMFDFSFKNVFDIENELSHENRIEKPHIENAELKQKLQFQIFDNDIYKGEIIELYESIPTIKYRSVSLQCVINVSETPFQLSIVKSNLNKPDLIFLIDLPENKELKSRLIRIGMYHHVLAQKHSITIEDIEMYIDLWIWKELAENPKIDWSNKTIFELFRNNGDGSVWNVISEKASIDSIKSIIQEYAEYWNWTTITKRFDNDFIKEQIEKFNWDFEELSYKEPEFVISLLSNSAFKDFDWDWNYLSKNLSDKFIEENIENFNWDFHEITVSKNDVFKNTFIKYRDKLETLISKAWNWNFISEEINLNFLHKNISGLASKLDWYTVLNRFFNNEEITAKCLKEESFKSLLKNHLPDNFVVAHQKYLWTPNLIDFFEQQNLIQWESKNYINGFDTNENVEWNKTIFQNYYSRISTEQGFLNISQHISDYSLLEEYPAFVWNWEGISQNNKLLINNTFIEKAFVGEFSFSNNLLWDGILLQSTFDIAFWNKNLEAFHSRTDSDKQYLFWKSLTQKENQGYILENSHFPWDWSFITENTTEETILDSFEDDELFEKWDWEIATRKLDKETILDKLEELARFIDWKFLINEVFTIEKELSMDNQLPRIADCLSVVNSEKRKDFWKELTAKFSFEILFPIVEETFQLDVFEWDWNFISNHKHFPTDTRTLYRFKQKINWSVFSESNAIHQKFNPSSWATHKEWLNNTDQYLSKFAENWDWVVLSKNKNVTYNRFILTKYKGEKWDWEYLTEFGGFLTKQKRDKEKYLEQVVKQFQLYIKFEFLSKRKDINIDSGLILATKDKKWDWQILSENVKVEISNEFILELKDKDWDWKAISKRKNLTFNNDTILQLLDKDWDFNYLSNNPNLEFNTEFIEETKAKPWNWQSVSQHKTFLPTIDILTLTNDFDLDWEYLSQKSNLNPTIEILVKFETKWNWYSITENSQINFLDIDFIERFAEKWNWRFICESGKLVLNNQILNQFKEFLKWDLISANTNINFTKEIIQEFKQYWNWTALKGNKRVEELLGSYVADEISKSSNLKFINKIEQQYSKWKGSIYHFSHIDNAVEIIKNRKIQSRNKATIKSDAAGNVVHLRDEAHDYARFYFRPHTPTQFYNEFLGKNTTDGYNSSDFGWVSWYEKARGLGFPKCPIPIFFKFSIQDVLFKNEKQCCISNGNMQTGSTQFGSVEKMINKFGFDDLYYTPEQYATKEDYNRYRNYAQQEFLVKDEFSFEDLTDFEIICPSDVDRTLLINLLGQENRDIFSKILVDRSYYNNENPRVRIEEEEFELHIKTEFSGQGYFVLSGTSKEIEILSGDVSKIDKDKIIFNSFISLGNIKQNIRLNFIDESGRNWFLYGKGPVNKKADNLTFSNRWKEAISNENYNPSETINLLKKNGYSDTFSYKIRHYILEFHTVLVCNVFEKHFIAKYSNKISLELFRTLLILHDIGKTRAFIEGNKDNQYEYTRQIINDLWKNLPYSDKELIVVLALLEEDYLGEYFQNKLNTIQVKDKLYSLSETCGIDVNSFFTIYMIYYQCDVASYTTDSGGVKFLEHLFEYDNGSKVFDESEGLIKMSSKYWEMYKHLKSIIENGD